MNPNAVSPVGAEGIAQFMPGTWRDVSRQMGIPYGISPRDAKWAIDAGAYYMARQRRTWSSPRPDLDRHFLAAASYNAGAGNLLKAQRLCRGAVLYDEIIACLPAVTGRHSRETITYVKRIQRWRAEMGAR